MYFNIVATVEWGTVAYSFASHHLLHYEWSSCNITLSYPPCMQLLNDTAKRCGMCYGKSGDPVACLIFIHQSAVIKRYCQTLWYVLR